MSHLTATLVRPHCTPPSLKLKPDGTSLDRLTAHPFPEMTSAVLLHTVAVKDSCLFPHVVALESSRDVVALPNQQTAQTARIM